LHGDGAFDVVTSDCNSPRHPKSQLLQPIPNPGIGGFSIPDFGIIKKTLK